MSQKSTFEIATELNQAIEENNRLQKIIDSYESNAEAYASKGTAELLRDMSCTLSFAANEIDSLEESVTELEFQLDCTDEEKKQLSIDLNHAIRRANYFENLEANVRSTLTTIAERQNRDNKKAKALEKENEHYKCRNKVLQEKVESLETEIRDFLFEDKDLEPKDLTEELAQILESVLDTVTEDDCSEYETEEEFYEDCCDDDEFEFHFGWVDTDNLPELSGCKKDDLDWNKLSPEFIAWRKKLLDDRTHDIAYTGEKLYNGKSKSNIDKTGLLANLVRVGEIEACSCHSDVHSIMGFDMYELHGTYGNQIFRDYEIFWLFDVKNQSELVDELLKINSFAK